MVIVEELIRTFYYMSFLLEMRKKEEVELVKLTSLLESCSMRINKLNEKIDLLEFLVSPKVLISSFTNARGKSCYMCRIKVPKAYWNNKKKSESVRYWSFVLSCDELPNRDSREFSEIVSDRARLVVYRKFSF
jgi:hypothetical protein